MRLGKPLIGLTVVVAAVVALSAFVAAMVMVIYPGAFRFTAPVLCPDDLPDAVVVQYNVQTSDGNATNFTLFCLGERGEFTEIGTWKPYALTAAGVAGLILVPIVLLLVVRAVASISGRRARPSSGAIPDQAGTIESSAAPEDSDSPLIS